jgi:bifunctional enzyme CysN/CysC
MSGIKNSSKKFNSFINQQLSLDTLRFITCGSVDDGKSTLIGRLLYDAGLILDDHLNALKNSSKTTEVAGIEIDFSLLLDGLESERAEGITVDVAYKYFETLKRKFIVADTPGHIEFTRNMISGASTATLAVLLIDARKGFVEQTRRHSIICDLLGIKKIILAINKMDLVNYSENIFNTICSEFTNFSAEMNFDDVSFIPLSALKGDNVVKSSTHINWYKGPTFLAKLESIDPYLDKTNEEFVMPVQLNIRHPPDFRGFAGKISRGSLSKEDNVKIWPSGVRTKVKALWRGNSEINKAFEGQNVLLELENNVSATRGDIITKENQTVKIADQFEVELIWLSKAPGLNGRSYQLKLAGQKVTAKLQNIKFRLDVNNGGQLAAKSFETNEIGRVTITTQRPLCFDEFKLNPEMGSFILINQQNNETVGAGIIRFALRRAENIQPQGFSIDKITRQKLLGYKSKVFWFTGLSGSGKSTIADAFAKVLHSNGILTYVLDGDNIRSGLNKDLGFTDVDRIENIRRAAEVAKVLVDAGITVITSFISPFSADRTMAKGLFEEGEFFEIYMDAPIQLCEQRDAKGLYKKARNREIPNFTGISSPYEIPKHPDLTLKSASTINENVGRLETLFYSDKR